jgi:hypothetical protein
MCTDECGALGVGLGGGDTSDEFVPRQTLEGTTWAASTPGGLVSDRAPPHCPPQISEDRRQQRQIVALLVETDSPTAIDKRINLIDGAHVLIHSAEHALQVA